MPFAEPRSAAAPPRFVLVLVLVAFAPGCATLVLGPGTAESNVDLGLSNVLLNYRPGNLGFGPETGFSRSAQATLARSLDIVIDGVDMADVASRTVYIPGFATAERPETARRADAAYVASRLAERVIEAHGQVALDRRKADYVLFPWIQVLGGITTYREYRSYGYPLYFHEEDQRPAWIMVMLYDRKKKQITVLEGTRTWQVRIESYILGFIPVEWFVNF